MSSQYSQRNQYQGNRPTGSAGQSNELAVISNETLQNIVVNGNAELIVKEADRIGKLLVQGGESENLSTSQIRAIFGEVRKIQGQIAIPEHTSDAETIQRIKERAFRRLYLLIPKMKYRVQKERGKPGIKKMVDVLEPAVRLVVASGISRQEQEKRFGYFVEFFEAILAYHRAYGGK